MKKNNIFDVLVIYSSSRTCFSSSKKNASMPFSKSRSVYNEVYAHFLEVCAKNNLRVAFTTTNDIAGSGYCDNYWLFKNKNWVKVNKPCTAPLIFDKFFPKNKKRAKQRDTLFSSPRVKSFTNEYLYDLFYDKLQTYLDLSHYSVPTVAIENSSIKNINESLTELKNICKPHINNEDFLNGVILKDRYGSQGNNIYRIESNSSKEISSHMKVNKKCSFILQPIVNFDKGIRYKDYLGPTEIRLLYLGKEIVQSYIRVAENKKALCNHGQGGIGIKKEDIPANILDFSTKIISQINRKNAFFALDFIVSNNKNVYLLEGNIYPGIDWYPSYPENVRMNKKTIDIIVKELSRRSLSSDNITKEKMPIIWKTSLNQEFIGD